ncbi:ATP-binding protein [Streptomyces sp. TRM43335]|uniref:ATP-binding protein n=2 Tax=Streptomyces taklimakanensis TaxID=2569853 RepID=A0A6G2BAQ9_9ACTN|nr:ATP-binding protein [Streptomyces taklimakanensis]MTE18982.1 ATP-binding protein [Streptomyces taklimakanensis]
MRFGPTPRGARLARRLVAVRLDEWGFPHDGDTARAACLLVAELAANAVVHGRVPGRDFAVRVALSSPPSRPTLRVEVTDPRGESRPPTAPAAPDPTDESGRGLLLVAALADRWGVREREPGPAPGKTVWAELDLR